MFQLDKNIRTYSCFGKLHAEALVVKYEGVYSLLFNGLAKKKKQQQQQRVRMCVRGREREREMVTMDRSRWEDIEGFIALFFNSSEGLKFPKKDFSVQATNN